MSHGSWRYDTRYNPPYGGEKDLEYVVKGFEETSMEDLENAINNFENVQLSRLISEPELAGLYLFSVTYQVYIQPAVPGQDSFPVYTAFAVIGEFVKHDD